MTRLLRNVKMSWSLGVLTWQIPCIFIQLVVGLERKGSNVDHYGGLFLDPNVDHPGSQFLDLYNGYLLLCEVETSGWGYRAVMIGLVHDRRHFSSIWVTVS